VRTVSERFVKPTERRRKILQISKLNVISVLRVASEFRVFSSYFVLRQ